MNKKFTMVCASLLLASAFSVNAQIVPDVPVTITETVFGEKVTGLPEGNSGKLYHLSVAGEDDALTNYALGISGDKLVLSDLGSNPYYASKSWSSSLWCVNVTRTEADGQNPIFDFTNSVNKLMLEVSVSGYNNTEDWVKEDSGDAAIYTSKYAAEVGGEVSGWKFTPVYESGMNKQSYYLGSYVGTDMMAVLVKDDANTVKVAVTRADNVEKVNNKIKFFLTAPVDKILTANDFNTVLATKKAGPVKLNFSPDANHPDFPNRFAEAPLMAEDAGDGFNYLYKLVDGKKHYLHVDTAYTNDKGTQFLDFAFMKNADEKFGANYPVTLSEPSTTKMDKLSDLGRFALYYDANDNNLYIRAKGVYYKSEADAKKYWNDNSADIKYVGSENIVITNTEDHRYGDINKTWVKLQNLEQEGNRIITIGAPLINTKIDFGFGSCDVIKLNKSSVDDNVYFIKNKAGQYLASVIYENGEVGAKFVTVNAKEQEVAHMPAYQWVVLKKYTQDKVKETSPISITNREFPNEYNTNTNIQLYKNDGADNWYLRNGEHILGDLTSDYLSFVAVPASSKEDPYLGYKKLTKEELMVNKYTFNYWHTYADDRFITAQNDSLLTVNSTVPVGFKLDTIAELKDYKNTTVDIPYGYNVTPGIVKRIPGLKQLVRTAYKVSYNGNTLAINKANQFNVGASSSVKGSKNGQNINYVFFKENNHINGKHYYAILEAYRENEYQKLVIEGRSDDKTIKAGVSDYDIDATLKQQWLNETRTSAFAIEPDNTPLYRRFNSEELEGNKGDTQDILRFYEKYRNEYLQMESNPNFIINKDVKYLGIDAENKAEGGLSFIVDTAWVNRGAGNVKPQYLISIDRNDFEGVPGEPCTEDDHHYDINGKPTDAEHCVHAKPAIPAFQRGWYLVNFDYMGSAITGDYKWKGYTRAGFVEAINYNDTLYILRDEFKNLPNEKIRFDAIKKAEAVAKTKKGYVNHIHKLTGDQHKYVTWSMRFLDKEKAANEVEEDRSFLFESMNYSKNADSEQWIAPEKGAWLKMQNGCLVLSQYDSSFDDIKTGGDDALIFNVKKGSDDDIATENETIATTEVAVIANNGSVVVKNAAGKNVVVSTILGQVVANEVLTSDNATINVPAGIVVVAVDGESFKVNVK